MQPRSIGETPTERCERCGGVWLAAHSFNELLINSDWQRAVLDSGELTGSVAESRTPLRCPDCAHEMRRANLGRRSGVIVDTCRKHGIWFDVGELRAAVGFLTHRLGHVRVATFLADLLSAR